MSSVVISPVKVITPVLEIVRSLISVATAPILVVEVPELIVTSVVLLPAVPAMAPIDIAPSVVCTVKSASSPKVIPPVWNVIVSPEVAFLIVVSPAPVWKASVPPPLLKVVSPPNI